MKFKVGDKVKVVKVITYNAEEKGTYIGKIFTISKIKNNSYPYEFEEDGIFLWRDEELEFAPFTKADLKDGMVVEYRNGQRRIVLGDYFMDFATDTTIAFYTDELINKLVDDLTIDKVYTSSACTLNDYRKDKYLTLIWERPKEEPVKKMTVAEIEKELGYKVEIVSEVN